MTTQLRDSPSSVRSPERASVSRGPNADYALAALVNLNTESLTYPSTLGTLAVQYSPISHSPNRTCF